MNENKLSWIEHAKISVRLADAIRAGVAKVKHHAKYTSRVHDAIKTAVREEFKDEDRLNYRLAFSFGDHDISVWGAVVGVDFSNRFYLIWNWPSRWNAPERQGEHWSVPILRECDRVDMRDYLERHAVEQAIMPRLLELERAAAAAVAAARAAADEIIKTLPSPGCASLRNADMYWSRLTSPHRDLFNFILPKD